MHHYIIFFHRCTKLMHEAVAYVLHSRILFEVPQRAKAMSEAALACHVQPLWELYAEAKKSHRWPDPAAVKAASPRWIGGKSILPAEIRLCGSGTAVTLNGIAQGFAADRAVEALRRYGIDRAGQQRRDRGFG